MMKKLLVLMVLGLAFIACDYAKESVELAPDIEITSIDPIGISIIVTGPNGGRGDSSTINEIRMVAENSVDCYLQELLLQYYDSNDNCFFTSEPIPMYAKIEGIVEHGVVDTTIIENLYLPLDTAVVYLYNNHLHASKVLLQFVAIDEYFDNTDTAKAWFGVYLDY
jgi:hypothetical protein